MSDVARIIIATDFATYAHRMQKRKGALAEPYIGHPIDVMKRLSQCGVTDVDVLMAGLCHDVIEDCDVTPQQLEEVIGARATSMVMECTDDKSLDKVTRKRLQLSHAYGASEGARHIKIADKTSNTASMALDPPIGWSAARIKGTMQWHTAVVLESSRKTYEYPSTKQLKAQFFDVLYSSGIDFETNTCLDEELEKYYALLA